MAILGLVNRGKSTLFNRLVGVDISAVAETPETAATIIASVGAHAAHGLTRAGEDVPLPDEPDEFLDSVRRREDGKITVAWNSGDFRLPPDLTLVDTPGVDDAAVDFSDSLVHLPDQWRESGASAAVVVLSFPPGPSARDRELIDHAFGAFPDAVTVALKATSSGIDPGDLGEVAEQAESTLGVPVMLLPDASAGEVWGTGPLAALEGEIDRIATAGARRLDADRKVAERFMVDLEVSIRETSVADLDALKALTAGALALPSSLRLVIEDQVRALEAARTAVLQEDEERERQQRTEFAEESAKRVAASLAGFRQGGDKNTIRKTYGELAELASRGSTTAIHELAGALRSEETLEASGLSLRLMLEELPDDVAIAVIGDSRLVSHRFVMALRLLDGKLGQGVITALQRRALVRLQAELMNQPGVTGEQLDDATWLASRALDPAVKRASAEVAADLAIRSLAKATNVPVTGQQAWSHIWERTQNAQQVIHDLASCTGVPVQEDRVNEILFSLAERAAPHVRQWLGMAHLQRVGLPAEWIQLVGEVEAIADIVLWLPRVRSSPVLDELANDLIRARAHRDKWLAADLQAEQDARRARERVVEFLFVCVIGSVGLFLLGIMLTLATLTAVAEIVVLVSVLAGIGSLLGWSHLKQRKFSTPFAQPPVEVNQARPAPGWYPDPLGNVDLYRWWTGYDWSHVLTPPGQLAPFIDETFTRTVPACYLPDPWEWGRWRKWDGTSWTARS